MPPGFGSQQPWRHPLPAGDQPDVNAYSIAAPLAQGVMLHWRNYSRRRGNKDITAKPSHRPQPIVPTE